MAKPAKHTKAAATKSGGRGRPSAHQPSPAIGMAATEQPSAPVQWRMVDRVQLGELLGVHPDTITDYTRKGMPVITLGGHGKAAAYDAVACSAWWRDQQGKNAKDAAQTRAFNATAELNELKLLREQGALLPREDVVRDGQSYTKAWASSVRAIARRARQSGIVTTPQAEAALNTLCRQLLTDIATWKTRADTDRASKKGVAA